MVGQVPLDGLADPGFEGLTRLPPQFCLNLSGVNGIAAIMAGAVLDKSDEPAVGHHWILGSQFVENCAYRVDNFQVALLVSSSNVIGFADSARSSKRSELHRSGPRHTTSREHFCRPHRWAGTCR